jgi:HK97 family phage prohead protease
MPMETLYRPVTTTLEIRSAEQGGSDGRTVTGIAVPWNHPQRIDADLVEQFEQGSADHVISAGLRGQAPGGLPAYRVHFAREHVRQGGSPIGRTVELRDDAAGLWGAWRVSSTSLGDETLELVRDQVYRELSIGFRSAPGWSRRLPDGVVSRTRFDLFEVALVLRGAYAEAAAVTGTRDEEDDGTARLSRARTIMAGWPMVRPHGVGVR